METAQVPSARARAARQGGADWASLAPGWRAALDKARGSGGGNSSSGGGGGGSGGAGGAGGGGGSGGGGGGSSSSAGGGGKAAAARMEGLLRHVLRGVRELRESGCGVPALHFIVPRPAGASEEASLFQAAEGLVRSVCGAEPAP